MSERKKKYLLHIKNGIIHDGEHACPAAKKMKESNKKWFDNYQEAVNFFEGDRRGEPCANCFKK